MTNSSPRQNWMRMLKSFSQTVLTNFKTQPIIALVHGWIRMQLPQASYPIIVVGYHDPLVAFGYRLNLCCFLGHVLTDEEYPATESGFSVLERESGEAGASVVMIQGFKQTPTVDDLLQLSNELLDGKIPTTPTVPQIPQCKR